MSADLIYGLVLVSRLFVFKACLKTYQFCLCGESHAAFHLYTDSIRNHFSALLCYFLGETATLLTICETFKWKHTFYSLISGRAFTGQSSGLFNCIIKDLHYFSILSVLSAVCDINLYISPRDSVGEANGSWHHQLRDRDYSEVGALVFILQ